MKIFTLFLRAFSVQIIYCTVRIECQRHRTPGATGLDPFRTENRGRSRDRVGNRSGVDNRNRIGTSSSRRQKQNKGTTNHNYRNDDYQSNFHSSGSSEGFSYTLNVRNSGQNDDWRQDELPSQNTPDSDRLTNIQNFGPPNIGSRQGHRSEFLDRSPDADQPTDVRRRGSSNQRYNQKHRTERRHIGGKLKSLFTRPTSRRNNSANRRHLTRTSDVQGRPPFRRQRVGGGTLKVGEPPLYRAYKLFYNETVASCGNGTYVCKFNTTTKLIEHPTCIPLSKRCDGTTHCPLGDDEERCPSPVCKSNQVRCHEGTCAQACDGIPECDQLEDEIFCAPVCLDGQLRCPGGNCAIVCDGKLECKNGEDERNCKDVPDTKVCKYGEILCRDRKTCAKVCDGISQCKDGVDEEFACDNL